MKIPRNRSLPRHDKYHPEKNQIVNQARQLDDEMCAQFLHRALRDECSFNRMQKIHSESFRGLQHNLLLVVLDPLG